MGPVQLLIVGLEEERLTGEIAAELERLREDETIRLLDLLLVAKDEGVRLSVVEASGVEGASGSLVRGLPEIAVMACGCLGLVSFPRLPGRVTREQIEERWPGLLPALREHPGIGFVLVRSREHGAVVLGPHGEHRLDSGELVGSHGGLGGPQAHPFVLAPADWPWPEEGVVGAEAMHRVLRTRKR